MVLLRECVRLRSTSGVSLLSQHFNALGGSAGIFSMPLCDLWPWPPNTCARSPTPDSLSLLSPPRSVPLPVSRCRAAEFRGRPALWAGDGSWWAAPSVFPVASTCVLWLTDGCCLSGLNPEPIGCRRGPRCNSQPTPTSMWVSPYVCAPETILHLIALRIMDWAVVG